MAKIFVEANLFSLGKIDVSYIDYQGRQIGPAEIEPADLEHYKVVVIQKMICNEISSLISWATVLMQYQGKTEQQLQSMAVVGEKANTLARIGEFKLFLTYAESQVLKHLYILAPANANNRREYLRRLDIVYHDVQLMIDKLTPEQIKAANQVIINNQVHEFFFKLKHAASAV